MIPNSTHVHGFRPGTLNVPGIASFVTAAGEVIESMELNRLGIAISSSTTCQVGQQQPSPTLLAMGLSKEEAYLFIIIGEKTPSSIK